MTKIRMLAPDVVEQIAAGEVVENPASVVKELVENSLDARASLVEVRIRESGLQEIRVTDDGIGIFPHEISSAFQRHSTSKLITLDDLLRLYSLGFRGEALASISAVSRVALTSRTPEEWGGMRIKMEGGERRSLEEVGAPVGTDIVVSDLFYNTPARRAFLKSPAHEARSISLLLTDLAFSFPEVAFSLWHEERLIFKTKGDGNILDIIAEVYGGDAPRSMLELKHRQQGAISIDGYISTPLLTRSTRQYQTFQGNRRLIRSHLLSGTLKRGYRGLIHDHRFPLAVIYLQVPPETVDVNIHPAKAEVRFHHDRDITGLLFKAVSDALGRTSPAITLRKEDVTPKRNFSTGPRKYSPHEKALGQKSRTYHLYSEGVADSRLPDDFQKDNTMVSAAEENNRLFPEEDYRVIGQYLSSYILAQKSDKLLRIDQQAAHERVLYEQYKEKYSEVRHDSQVLASPISVEVPASLAESMPKYIKMMENTGFKIELFGENTYLVREIPAILADIFNREYFLDLIEYINSRGEIPDDSNELVIKMMACKSAVKANQKMSLPEIRQLIKEWGMTATPFYCPHGRPTLISFTRHELEKGFRRKGGY